MRSSCALYLRRDLQCNHSSFALPVFVDSDIETFQIDATKIQSKLTDNTKLLVPVHIGGSVADVDAIQAIAQSRKIAMIEDACQAPLAQWWQTRRNNGIGRLHQLSNVEEDLIREGGAILTNDDDFANRCYNFHTLAVANLRPALDVDRTIVSPNFKRPC